jgi:hypothetical protein
VLELAFLKKSPPIGASDRDQVSHRTIPSQAFGWVGAQIQITGKGYLSMFQSVNSEILSCAAFFLA